jgi:replicative DNA helicase
MAVNDWNRNQDGTAGDLPPQDLSAEQATLGSILIEPGAAMMAMGLLEEQDFYLEAHQVIFRAMRAVLDRNEPVDLVTVSAELRRTGTMERSGGVEYLTAVINAVATAAHVGRYAGIVAEKSVLRKLITAGSEIQALGYDNPAGISEVLDLAEQKIFEIAQRRTASDFVALRPLVESAYANLEHVYRYPGFLSGVSTGLGKLDKITSGLQPGDLIILAARPSMGKTSLAVANFALHAATQVAGGTGVGIFSLEMSQMQLTELLLCSHARVNSWALRHGLAKDEDWGNIGRSANALYSAPIYIDATPGIPILELRSKARRLKAQFNIGLLIVDYLQLVTTGMRYGAENRHQEVSLIARSLKGLARELNVPVVALSQLSRRVESREDKRPILSDLAESGSIEAEADLVCFLYRAIYYERKKATEQAERGGAPQSQKEDYSQPSKAEIIIAKHRNGPTGTVETVFHPQYRTFFDVEDRKEGDAY